MTNNRWSEDDEIYLEYYLFHGDETSLEPAAEYLNRSISSVAMKSVRLRRKNENVGYVSRPYTRAELEFIKHNYNMLPLKSIAERLNRTPDAIKIKASRIGINKNKSIKKHDKEIRELAQKGHYRTEIARKLRLSISGTSEYINNNNIECEYCPKEIMQEYWRREEKNRWEEIKNRIK